MSPTTRSEAARRSKRRSKPDLDRARQAAKNVLAELDLLRPTEVTIQDLAAARGALVAEGLLTGAEARLEICPGRPALITVSKRVKNKGQWLFSIAHELGHLECHADRNRPQGFDDNDIGGQKGGKYHHEIETNAFAAELLMPERFWRDNPPLDAPRLGLRKGGRPRPK